jgi:hypothetical protein
MGKRKNKTKAKAPEKTLLREELMFFYSEAELCEKFMVASDVNIISLINNLFPEFMKTHPLRDPTARYGVAIHPPPRSDDTLHSFKTRHGVNPVVIIKNESSSLSHEISQLRQEKPDAIASLPKVQHNEQREMLAPAAEEEEDEKYEMPPLPRTEEGVVDSKRLVNWMDDSRKYLDALLEHLQKKDQDHMKWQAQKNRELDQRNKDIENWKSELDQKNKEIENWKTELQAKNEELRQKNKEIEDESGNVKSLMAAYKKQVSAMAAIRIYAAIEYYLKHVLAIPLLQQSSVGKCCADPNLVDSFSSLLADANSLLSLDDLNAMQQGIWNKRRPVAHGLPDQFDLEEAINCAELDESSKAKLFALITPLYES